MPLYHIIELTSTCWWKDMKPIRTVRNLLWRAEPGQDYIRNGGIKIKRKNELDDQKTKKQKRGGVRKEEC